MASSISMLIIGIFVGVAIANQLPMDKQKSPINDTEADYIAQIESLNQEVIKQTNMRENCEALLNKIQK